jgi:hypothetical protein
VRGTWVIPVVVSACGFSPAKADGGHAIDAADATVFMDAQPDAPSDEVCFGTLTYDTICFKKTIPLPTNTRNINGDVMLHSDDNGVCDPNALGVMTGVCVVSADKIIITGGSTLHVTGALSVILLATGTDGINLNATSMLDFGSTSGIAGAGSLASCSGATAATGHGGGFGGSFVATGGTGGNDGDGAGKGLPATVLGAPTTLHGGCPGGLGNADNPNQDAAAGNGGGGVVLIAAVITIDGLIAADGGGGKGSVVNNTGGGGAGAGGMIVLDSPSIKGNGEVNVKGGGGGGGAGGLHGGDGHAGYDPNPLLDGAGGTDASSGGDGGRGGPSGPMFNDPAGEAGFVGVGATVGGGGGGGARGVIVTTSTPASSIVGAN